MDIQESINKVANLSIPKGWLYEPFEPPNDFAKSKTCYYLKFIFDTFQLEPYRVETSVEEGIMITYMLKNKRILHIEIYNDGEAAGSVTFDKETEDVKNIFSDDDVIELANQLFKETK